MHTQNANIMDKVFIATTFHRTELAQNKDWEKMCSIFSFPLEHTRSYGCTTQKSWQNTQCHF